MNKRKVINIEWQRLVETIPAELILTAALEAVKKGNK